MHSDYTLGESRKDKTESAASRLAFQSLLGRAKNAL